MVQKNKFGQKVRLGALTAVCALGLAAPVYGAEAVTVTLPNFPITLNGTVIDNNHRQYPLLTYRGITYFPLTYYDTRFLGVESQWDQAEKMLSVESSDISGGYQADSQLVANGRSYQATVCDFSVQVNGTAIDNSKEPYPLLVFRDVTYFPMTWAYGVEQFGWQYQFQEGTGLTIDSGNLQTNDLDLDLVKVRADSNGRQGDYGYQAYLVGDYVYYQGAEGAIYQALADGSGEHKKVFQLPKWSYGDLEGGYVMVYMSQTDGKMVLKFHQGGATMGHDEIWLFEADGTSRQINEIVEQNIAQGDGFTISTGSGMTSYLYKTVNGEEPVRIGGDSILYCGMPVIQGQKVYVVGSEFDQAINADRHGLYEVDLISDHSRLINDPAIRLDFLSADQLGQVPGTILYFVGGKMNSKGLWAERHLYQVDIAGGNPQASDVKLVAKLCAAEPLYAFVGKTLYYGTGTEGNQRLHRLGEERPLMENGRLKYLYNEQGYIIAGFEETADNDTRLLVLNEAGEILYRSADVAQRPQIDQGRLFYMTKDGQSFVIKLS